MYEYTVMHIHITVYVYNYLNGKNPLFCLLIKIPNYLISFAKSVQIVYLALNYCQQLSSNCVHAGMHEYMFVCVLV